MTNVGYDLDTSGGLMPVSWVLITFCITYILYLISWRHFIVRLDLQIYLGMYVTADSTIFDLAYSGVDKAAGRGTECSEEQETSTSLLQEAWQRS